MREIARQPGDTGGTISVARTAAPDHAAARGVPKGEEPLDLSNVKAILNGSRRSRRRRSTGSTTRSGRFGTNPRPSTSYGLAEATLFVLDDPDAQEEPN